MLGSTSRVISYVPRRNPLFRALKFVPNGHRTFSVAPFPVRVGYGLGSVIPKEVVQSMKDEAKIRGKLVELEQIEHELESAQRELTMEKNALKNKQNHSQTMDQNELEKGQESLGEEMKKWIHEQSGEYDKEIKELAETRKTVLKDKMKAYKELVKFQRDAVNPSADSTNKTYHFTTFDTNVPSPIDWDASTIVFKDRASDSIELNSHFFMTDDNEQSASSKAGNIGGHIKSKAANLGAKGAAGLAAKGYHSAESTHQQHTVEHTLVLTAMATHKMVKQFSPLIADPDQMLDCWNTLFPDNKLDMTETGGGAMENAKEGDDDKLSIISAEFMGSAMVGMVHFIKRDSTEQKQTANAAQLASAISAATKGAVTAGQTGDTSIAANAAKKALALQSSSGLDVKFDLICQGYLPKIKDDSVIMSIKEFANFSPDKIDVQSTDGKQHMLGDLSEEQQALINENKKQSTAESHSGAMIKSTIQGMTDAKESSPPHVLDANTFMTAFADYVQNVSSPNSRHGVPCGMEIKSWSKLEVRALCGRKWDPDSVNETGYGSKQTPSAKTAAAKGQR